MLLGSAAGLVAAMAAEPAGASNPEPENWTAADIPPQQGRRVVVTGGNGYPFDGRSGLGFHIARALAAAGADVTIASRNRAKGEEAVRRIVADAPQAIIRFEPLDLADLASVLAFAAKMRGTGSGLDLLVNNAGVMGRPRREKSADGFERVFATNTLGHFVLTAALLPMLRTGHSPRVGWMASLRVSETLPFDDLQLERNYDYAAAYDHSKLANLSLAMELHRRSKAAGWGVDSLAAHPGVARTNLIPDGPGLASREGWRFRWLPFLFQPPEQGALPALYASVDKAAAGGNYYAPTGIGGIRGLPGKAEIPPAALDPMVAARLWAELERLGQTRFG